MLRHVLSSAALAAVFAAAWLAPTAAGTSTGGCPTGTSEKWELVTVTSIGIDPEVAKGIPSLDGNADGYTCIHRLPNHPVAGAFIFRDNTVKG